ncbi:MAG: nucleotidyltransferase family protein [Candidatus Methanofastidiosum sp.]|nr:nucleotidyltransferase family protein [Methanofastidiosum sp.]
MNPSERNKTLVSFLTKHGAKKIGIFGSVARGEDMSDSDIDILVEFNEVKSLFEMVGIELDLADVLGKKIDLVTEGALSPYIKDKVLKDLVVIYDERKRGNILII